MRDRLICFVIRCQAIFVGDTSTLGGLGAPLCAMMGRYWNGIK